MSFTQELTRRWSTSTWTPTRLLPARSFAQKLLHRSWHTGDQLTSSGSNCMWTPAKSDFSSSSISFWQIPYPYRGGGRGGTKPTCRIPLFPECVASVPVSLWGSGGWGCVRSTVATVRNRPQPSARLPYGRAYGKFCRGGHFWRFQTSRCFVSRGRRGTSWHSEVFCNVSKIVLCGRRNTFATFSEDAWQFSWQAQHFGRVHRHFSWQAHHFRRVVLGVFCKSHWQGCVKWRQVANSVAGVAFCDMCWKLTEASHETSILRL